MSAQLPLQFEFNTQQTFQNYFAGPNHKLLALLAGAVRNKNERLIYIWGAAGIGKTHLLNASCQLANEIGLSSFLFSLQNNKLPDAALLEDLEQLDLVCFDNIEQIAGNQDWELAFFNFFNRHRERDGQLILSSSTPPHYLNVDLPDLKTRFNWGLTLSFQTLDDAAMLAALRSKAELLGIRLEAEVGRYLIQRYVGDQASLWQLLEQLNHASLAAKRRLTIPFLKSYLSSP